MSDKEEYHLPEEEKTEEYSEQAYSSTTENIRSILMNRRVQMMLGGVVGLTLIMMVASWFGKTPPTKVINCESIFFFTKHKRKTKQKIQSTINTHRCSYGFPLVSCAF